jgi:hypothetical protein
MIKKTKVSLIEQNSKLSRVTDEHTLKLKDDRQGTYNITLKYDKKCIMVFMSSTNYSCQVSIKLEFSRQIFEKYSNVICRENPTSESRVVPCGRTDMKKLIVAFRNFVKAPKNKGKITKSVCDSLSLIDIYTTSGNKTVLSVSTGLKKKEEN